MVEFIAYISASKTWHGLAAPILIISSSYREASPSSGKSGIAYAVVCRVFICRMTYIYIYTVYMSCIQCICGDYTSSLQYPMHCT